MKDKVDCDRATKWPPGCPEFSRVVLRKVAKVWSPSMGIGASMQIDSSSTLVTLFSKKKMQHDQVSSRKQGVSPILIVFACMWFSSVVINSAQAKRTSTGKSRAQVVVCMCPNIKLSKRSKTFKKRKVIAFLPKMIALSPPLTQSTGVGRTEK